ncbi:MBL fold metallo-hydrolase [Rhizobium helianthi]|uniref:MBL fold metallo-hydrolase n=1 Tax=Rhizobium helianthi TaxID=1132695 RepID=A0ABW4LYL5_9HYPH
MVPHEQLSREFFAIAPDIAYLRTVLVNVVFIGAPGAGDRNWVLVDTGVFGSHDSIVRAAASRFGEGARPAAIIQTHGHFDHVGSLETLAGEWDAPVYAHSEELPFLSGQESYAPPDTAADGGIIPKLSGLFPRSPVNVAERLRALPPDRRVPPLLGWEWIHTPGHSPGHISLWREVDRTLVVGDAFITTGQESAYEVAAQTLEMHGPPRYFTSDWIAAGTSVTNLAALEPKLAITGHGRAVGGPRSIEALRQLADGFMQIAPPAHLAS